MNVIDIESKFLSQIYGETFMEIYRSVSQNIKYLEGLTLFQTTQVQMKGSYENFKN